MKQQHGDQYCKRRFGAVRSTQPLDLGVTGGQRSPLEFRRLRRLTSSVAAAISTFFKTSTVHGNTTLRTVKPILQQRSNGMTNR
jgi:hypothetical protein